MTPEQQLTSLELSKKLKELGVKQESLFCWLEVIDDFNVLPEIIYYKKSTSKGSYGENGYWEEKVYSAFTVAELGEMLPWEIFEIDKGKYLVDLSTLVGEDGWRSSLLAVSDSKSNLNNHIEKSDTEANARAKMLIYLLENKLI